MRTIKALVSKKNLLWNNPVEVERFKIKQIKTLQYHIAHKYTKIMAFTSRRCIEIMGTPPCKYALVGMGSLARKEIKPYSDFEHFIVLEEFLQHQNREHILEYFRWYSVIFHIIVVNLQETVVRNVWIPGLNNYLTLNGDWFYDNITTKGISFDGMMPYACKVPLGRTYETSKKPWTTELIKPVSEMVKYVEVEEELKNGYGLADILAKACFVAGFEHAYKTFCEKSIKTQQKQANIMEQQANKRLKEDIEKFNIANPLKIYKASKSLDVKRAIYRSFTLFVTALGQFHRSNQATNFEILDNLYQRDIINHSTFHDLSYVVAIACLLRLYQYTRMHKQNDSVTEYSKNFFGSDKSNFFLAVVSKQEFVKFFRTVLRLQTALTVDQSYNIKKHFVKNEIWPGFAAKALMELYDEVILDGKRYLREQDIQNVEGVAVMQYFIWACYVKKDLNGFFYLNNCMVQSRVEISQLTYAEKGDPFPILGGPFESILNRDITSKNTDWVSTMLKPVSARIDPLFPCALPCLSGDALTRQWRYREALSSFREYFHNSKFNINGFSLNASFRASALVRVTLGLIAIGHPNQALDHAFEGLEFLDQHCSHMFPIRFEFHSIISGCYCVLGHTNQAQRYHNLYQSGLRFYATKNSPLNLILEGIERLLGKNAVSPPLVYSPDTSESCLDLKNPQ